MTLSSRRGFTLVELSIVLVILGLLVGGVLTGQSLIRAAELRAVVTEQTKYLTAANAFRDKYFAIPGDMNNATSFWTSGTANGNGDGTLSYASGASVTGEVFQFWNQLSLAGLIEGTYSGLAGAAGNQDHVLGTNAPRSKMPNAGWGISYTASIVAGNATSYVADYNNFFTFGSSVSGNVPYNSVLKPEEAWNIDMKTDDGKPGTGKLLIRENATFAGAATAKCSTSANNTDYAGNYNLSNSAISCSLFFPKPF